MKKTTATLTTTLGLVLGSLHAQTVPPFINYQGKVTDSAGVGLGTGTPVNRKVIFRVFDAPTAGNRLWSEQHTVTISNGEFSVLLGNGIDAVFNGATETPLKSTTPFDAVFTSTGVLRYVEIVVDNGDNTLNTSDAAIAPRQQITSTAYSFRARAADTITSGTDLQLNGSANYGLGYYGSTRLFNGTPVDGPVLFGQAGGALGAVNGGTKNIALRWNAAGAVGIGSADLSGAATTTKLVVQGDDSNAVPLQLNIRGNTDTNKRLLLGYNTTSNYGSIQPYSAASIATNLLLNPGGGNVGIGMTAAPGSKLTVNGNVEFMGRVSAYGQNGYSFGGVGDADGGLFSPADGTVVIRTDNSEKFRVSPSGSVGIGTTTPAFPLSFPTVEGDKISLYGDTGDHYGIGIANSRMIIHSSNASSDVSFGYGRYNAMTETMRITGAGNLIVQGDNSAITVGTNTGTHGALYLGNASHGVKRNYSQGNDVGLYTAEADLYLSAQGGGVTSAFVLKNSGKVGIGTSSPVVKLDVIGKTNITMYDSNEYGQGIELYTKGGVGNIGIGGTYAAPVSIRADGWIATGNGLVVYSDKRIKRDAQASITTEDLDDIQKLKVTNYRMIDPADGGTAWRKGFIAQELEKVIPGAVSQSKEFVPNLFASATAVQFDSVAKTLALTLTKDHELKAGDRVRLHIDGQRQDLEVLKAASASTFVVKNCEKAPEKVFVFGKEVSDFRTVDYDRVFTTAVGALQELKREKDTEVASLRDENSQLRARVAELEANDSALGSKISAIEAMLSSSGNSTARTVSVSTANLAK